MRVVAGGAGGANIQAQVRQRMAERFKEDFAAFRATLDEAQGKQWDSALANLLVEQEEILILVIPNVVFNGQLSKPAKRRELLKMFVFTRFVTLLLRIYSKMD